LIEFTNFSKGEANACFIVVDLIGRARKSCAMRILWINRAHFLSTEFRNRIFAGIAILLALVPVKALAGEATIAVASNFYQVLQELKQEFEATTPHRLFVTTGSTGKHYAQIINGAPYDVLLAADQQRVALLIKSGKAVETSRFTYAYGKLALWSANPQLIDKDGTKTLRSGQFRNLAMANPALAPYGQAARMVLKSLGLWDALQDKLVMGQNVGQTYSLVVTGNAELGFVAKAHLTSPKSSGKGSSWLVPIDLYDPIRQDGVLLVRAIDNPAAKDFMAYLASDGAKAIIKRFGYGIAQ